MGSSQGSDQSAALLHIYSANLPNGIASSTDLQPPGLTGAFIGASVGNTAHHAARVGRR